MTVWVNKVNQVRSVGVRMCRLKNLPSHGYVRTWPGPAGRARDEISQIGYPDPIPPPLLSFRRFSMSILLIVFWSRFGQVGQWGGRSSWKSLFADRKTCRAFNGFAKNIRLYLHQEFRAAENRFYLHKDFARPRSDFIYTKNFLRKIVNNQCCMLKIFRAARANLLRIS